MEPGPPASQASSHFPLEPVTGATLLRLEMARRNGLEQRGSCRTGCRELDEHVLLGGFDRGCVVGVSAEEEEIGLLMGLQTIAALLAARGKEGAASTARIITTLPTATLLPSLRNVVDCQVRCLYGRDGDAAELRARVLACLERISISRVFEFEGLWEVLSELDQPSSTPEVDGETPPRNNQAQAQPLEGDEFRAGSREPSMEIQDSEDEGGLSSPEPNPSVKATPQKKRPNVTRSSPRESTPSRPDIILITHMSALLASLFARREKSAAHTMLQLLSWQLRYTSRSPKHGGPLILILNSTTTPKGGDGYGKSGKPPDPTLRSIFNPPPLPTSGLLYGFDTALSRRNKPSFGLVFTQLLDLHLLCSRVPRSRADAEALHAPSSAGNGDQTHVSYAWVVEVLLDEMGAWDPAETMEGGRSRRSREQRWGAVDVADGRRVVDASERREKALPEMGTAGGFGGLRP